MRKAKMDKLYLYSTKTVCCASENSEDSDVIKAKFAVSDFSTNRNKVRLNRKTIANWMNTLVGKPLVGKLTSSIIGEPDFTGHNMKKVERRDEDGNKYEDAEFDTQAFGVFTNVGIEDIDGDECIVADCDIWKRFPKACSVIEKRIQEGTLNTSWEISINKSHKETIGSSVVKVIDDGVFIGHCLLGKNVTPAYDASRLLEVAEAEEDFDDELSIAYSEDISLLKNKDSEEKEDTDLKRKNGEVEAAEVTQDEVTVIDSASDDSIESSSDNATDSETSDGSEEEDTTENTEKASAEDNEAEDSKNQDSSESERTEETETSATKLTDYDVMHKLFQALAAKGEQGYIAFHFPIDKTIWVKDTRMEASDLDYLVYTYDVDEQGNFTLNGPEPAQLAVEFKNINNVIADMNSAIAEANEKINAKDAEIAELLPYKEKFEAAEAERIAAEKAEKVNALRQYAINSKLISEAEVSEGGELASMVNDLNENGIKAVIAERYMSSFSNSVETSSTEVASVSKETVQRSLPDSQEEILDYNKVWKSYMGK